MGTASEVNNLILYDGVCKFCNSSVNFILNHERAKELSFASLQSKKGQDILIRFGLTSDYTDSLLLLSNEKIYSHSRAAFKIATFLRIPWSWLSIFKILPTFFTDFVYDLLAKHRYKLMGKSEVCMVPTVENKDRFLE